MKFANSKRLCQLAVVLAFLLVFLPTMAEEKKSLGNNVAMVNGVGIPRVQYTKELNIHLDRISRQGRKISDKQLGELKKQILEDLIEREVIYQESRKAGIKITEQKVDDQLANIKKNFADKNEYQKALSKMDLTEDEVKIQIEHGLAIRELINQKIAGQVIVTDKESKAYYDGNPQFFRQPEQVKASHILIKTDPDADEAKKTEARQKIEEVQQKLKDGGDFAELAKRFSEGPSNTRGGDLGYFRRGQMVKPFEAAAFAMQLNEVSGIVETRFGYHIIKVYDRRPEQVLALEEVKDKIIKHLKQEKVKKEADQYVDKLKKDAKIEKFL